MVKRNAENIATSMYKKSKVWRINLWPFICPPKEADRYTGQNKLNKDQQQIYISDITNNINTTIKL